MNPTIIFNKEEAEKYIRENIYESLKHGKFESIKILIVRVVFVVLPLFLSFALLARIFDIIFFRDHPLFFALAGACFGLAIFCLLYLSDFRKAFAAHQKYEKDKEASIHDLYNQYSDYTLWCENFYNPHIEHAYNNYCTFVTIASGFLHVAYSEKSHTFSFELADENGDISKTNVTPDKIKENCNIKNDTLIWKDGEVTFVKKYHRQANC